MNIHDNWTSIEHIRAEIDMMISDDTVFDAIATRKEEIDALKEAWRWRVELLKSGPLEAVYRDFGDVLSMRNPLEPILRGVSGSYVASDNKGVSRYIVKPVDEGQFCLNNPKKLATPFKGDEHKHQYCSGMTLYGGGERTSMFYDMAEILGMPGIVPPTFLAIVSSEAFHDISGIDGPKEKLCSCQEFINDAEDIYAFLTKIMKSETTVEEFSVMIPRRDFENIMILTWLGYMGDCHVYNFLVTPPYCEDTHNGLFKIKKIDNERVFPEKSYSMKNNLLTDFEFIHKYNPLTLSSRFKIEKLPSGKIIERMKFYGLENSVAAFEERVGVLQKLLDGDVMTIEEIDVRMYLLGKAEKKGLGNEIAFFPIEELEKIFET